MRTLLVWLLILLAATAAAAQAGFRAEFKTATALVATGDFQSALTHYEQARKRLGPADSNVDIARVHYNIGVCLYRLGRNAESVAELTTAVALRPDYDAALYALAMAESGVEHWPQAREAFLKLLSRSPKNAEAWFDLGFVHLAEKDYPAAAGAFRNAIRFRSVDEAYAHNNLGVLLAMDSDLEAAEAEFTTALQLTDGTMIEAKRNLDYCRRYRQRTADSIAVRLTLARRAEPNI